MGPTSTTLFLLEIKWAESLLVWVKILQITQYSITLSPSPVLKIIYEMLCNFIGFHSSFLCYLNEMHNTWTIRKHFGTDYPPQCSLSTIVWIAEYPYLPLIYLEVWKFTNLHAVFWNSQDWFLSFIAYEHFILCAIIKYSLLSNLSWKILSTLSS